MRRLSLSTAPAVPHVCLLLLSMMPIWRSASQGVRRAPHLTSASEVACLVCAPTLAKSKMQPPRPVPVHPQPHISLDRLASPALLPLTGTHRLKAVTPVTCPASSTLPLIEALASNAPSLPLFHLGWAAETVTKLLTTMPLLPSVLPALTTVYITQ